MVLYIVKYYIKTTLLSQREIHYKIIKIIYILTKDPKFSNV